MDMIGKIQRMHFRQNKSARVIARSTELSRNTVRCYLREEQAVLYAPPTGRSPTRHSTTCSRRSSA